MRMEDRDGRWRRLESDKADTLAALVVEKCTFPRIKFPQFRNTPELSSSAKVTAAFTGF